MRNNPVLDFSYTIHFFVHNGVRILRMKFSKNWEVLKLIHSMCDLETLFVIKHMKLMDTRSKKFGEIDKNNLQWFQKHSK